MKKETLKINGSDDRTLNAYAYHPDGTSKGIVHILHGMGEHAGRYDGFAKFLSENGLTVYAHDHRNHGKSVSNEENVGIFDKSETFETMVDDTKAVQDYIRTNEGEKPLTMLGHSMGSAVLRRYLQKDSKNPDQAIFMGTLPRYNIFSGGAMFVLSWLSGVFVNGEKRHRFVNFLLNKSMTRNIPDSESDLDWLAQNQKTIDSYEEDPLSGFVYNKYFYNSLFKSLITLNKASEISKTPAVRTLFISGYNDPLSKEMVAIHKLNDVYKKLVDGFDSDVKPIYKARHEVLNENNKDYTYDYLLNWILNR